MLLKQPTQCVVLSARMLKTILKPMSPILLCKKASRLFFDFQKSETKCPRNGSALPAQSINSNEVLISVTMPAPAFVDDVLMNKICALMSLMWLRDTHFNQLPKSKMIGREEKKKKKCGIYKVIHSEKFPSELNELMRVCS